MAELFPHTWKKFHGLDARGCWLAVCDAGQKSCCGKLETRIALLDDCGRITGYPEVETYGRGPPQAGGCPLGDGQDSNRYTGFGCRNPTGFRVRLLTLLFLACQGSRKPLNPPF